MSERPAERFSVISDGLPSQLPDVDPTETQEWLDSFDDLVASHGRPRARFVMLKLLERAREKSVGVPDADGQHRARSFGRKKDADRFLTLVRADLLRAPTSTRDCRSEACAAARRCG